MTTHHILNKMARLKISRDQTRVMLSLAERGKTIREINKENPGLASKNIPRMVPRFLKRGREGPGKQYTYRLTEHGMNTVKLLFDEETTPTVNHNADSPPLPFDHA